MNRFPYQKLLEVKEKLKDKKVKELYNFFETLEKITGSIKDTEEEINKQYRYMEGSLCGSDFSVLKDYIYYLEEKRMLYLKEKRDIQKRIEDMRHEIINIVKEIKMFENIKSKRLKAFLKEERKNQRKHLDSLGLRKEKNFP